MTGVQANSRRTILSTLEQAVENGQEKTVRKSLSALHQLDSKDGSSSLKSNAGYDLLRLSLQTNHTNISKLLLKHGIEVNRRIARKTCNTPLHLAIKNNDLKIVKMLLKSGADTKCRNSQGKTPLYLAVELDHEDIAELLLKKDVEVNTNNRNGMAAVHAAAYTGNEYLFNLLLSKGGKPVIRYFDKDSTSMLHVAIEHCYVKTVEKIVKSSITSKILKNPGSEKFLTVAVMNYGSDYRKIVEILLQAKFPIVLEQAKNSQFICCALENKYTFIINQLLKIGLDLDDYNDVLKTACKYNNIETVEAIIDKVKDVNFKTCSWDDSNLLFNVIDNIHSIIKEANKNVEGVHQNNISLFNRWFEIMKILVKKGIDVNYYNFQKLTPLHYLANHTSSHASLSLKPIANLLITAGAWTSKMKSSMKPLDYAISKESPDVVDVLLQCNCDIDDGSHGASYLHQAAKNKSSVIIEMFLKRRANVNVIDASGNTPLHTAAAAGRFKVMECLLKHNFKVNTKNFVGKTPLHLVILHGQSNGNAIEMQCIETLMKYKADVDARDQNLETPLHHAAQFCSDSSAIKKLLDHKANIHSTNKLGLTPLLVAASFNIPCIIKFLIKSGANISDKNKYGETVLHLIAKRRYYPINKILEDNADINALSYRNKTALDYLLDVQMSNARILVEHMLKLHNIGVYLCEENLQGIDKYLKTSDDSKAAEKSGIVLFKEECEKEAVLLKESKIGDSTMTFYKLFKKSTHRLAQYLLNKSVIKEIKPANYKKKFPIYSGLITETLERGFERKKILDQESNGSVKRMLHNLPNNCIDEILSYLENGDLQALITASETTMETADTYSPMVTRSHARKKLKLSK